MTEEMKLSPLGVKLRPAKCLMSTKCPLAKTCARAYPELSSGPWSAFTAPSAVCGSYVDATPVLIAEKLNQVNSK